MSSKWIGCIIEENAVWYEAKIKSIEEICDKKYSAWIAFWFDHLAIVLNVSI